MVKIARKGFEVLSKGEGQATAWRPKNLARVKKKVLAFNVEDQIYIRQSVESDLMHLELFIFNEWNQVTCSRWLYSSDKDQS